MKRITRLLLQKATAPSSASSPFSPTANVMGIGGAAAGGGGSSPLSIGNSSAAKDTLTMANATMGFFGAAIGHGTADDPAPGDLKHSSGVDSLSDSYDAFLDESNRGGGGLAATTTSSSSGGGGGPSSSSSALPPPEPIDASKAAEARNEAERRASPSDSKLKESFIVKRAMFTNPPPTAAFGVDGRPQLRGETSFGSAEGAARDNDGNALMPRRWSREANELCVEHTIRTRKHLTDYIMTYRWDDPNWRPILSLPCGNPIAMEMRARHCNIALKHIAQQGHAAYNIQHVQHSVLHPEGVAERAYVETSVPKKDRLVTNIIHEGVFNKKDIGNVNAGRGVLAVSQVQGYGQAFQRKPLLWQRSRRIGALQSEMGAIEWELHGPAEVGRTDPSHVMLLSPHTQYVGGGVSCTAIVSSLHMAQHPFHYVAEFEAPPTTVMDAVHQAAYLLAKKNKLIKSDGSEQLHLLGSLARSNYPYSPVELDLHFKIMLGAPTVMRHREEYPSSLIGAPLVDGGAVFMCEYTISQGVSNYVYDDMPSALPHRWWQQKNAAPYVGNLYFCRTGQLKNLQPFEEIVNPFEKLNASSSSSAASRGRRGRRGAAQQQQSSTNTAAGASEGGDHEGEASASSATEEEEAFRRTTSSQLSDEELLSTSGLVSSEVKRHYDAITSMDVSMSVPPNDRARERMRRMAKSLNKHKNAEKKAEGQQ